jgi:hypothetical protein
MNSLEEKTIKASNLVKSQRTGPPAQLVAMGLQFAFPL